MYCKNYDNGCCEIFAQAEGLNDHQRGCMYRLVFCPDLGCDFEVVELKDIVEHLKNEHGEQFKEDMTITKIVYSENMKCEVAFPFENVTDDTYLTPTKLDFIDGVEFFFVGDVVHNIMHCLIYFLGSPLEAGYYTYTMSFTSKDGEKCNYYGHVQPLDKNSHDIIAKQSVFMIGAEVVKSSKLEDGNVKFEFQINALKEEAKDKDEESGVEDGSD